MVDTEIHIVQLAFELEWIEQVVCKCCANVAAGKRRRPAELKMQKVGEGKQFIELSVTQLLQIDFQALDVPKGEEQKTI